MQGRSSGRVSERTRELTTVTHLESEENGTRFGAQADRHWALLDGIERITAYRRVYKLVQGRQVRSVERAARLWLTVCWLRTCYAVFPSSLTVLAHPPPNMSRDGTWLITGIDTDLNMSLILICNLLFWKILFWKISYVIRSRDLVNENLRYTMYAILDTQSKYHPHQIMTSPHRPRTGAPSLLAMLVWIIFILTFMPASQIICDDTHLHAFEQVALHANQGLNWKKTLSKPYEVLKDSHSLLSLKLWMESLNLFEEKLSERKLCGKT